MFDFLKRDDITKDVLYPVYCLYEKWVNSKHGITTDIIKTFYGRPIDVIRREFVSECLLDGPEELWELYKAHKERFERYIDYAKDDMLYPYCPNEPRD